MITDNFPNSNLLDDDIKYNIGGAYSNGDGEEYAKATVAVADTIGKIAESRKPKTEDESRIITVCGRKGLLWGKAKKDAYAKCVAKVMAEKTKQVKLETEKAKAQATIPKMQDAKTSKKDDNKKYYIIGGVAAGVILLGAIAVIVIKKMKS